MTGTKTLWGDRNILYLDQSAGYTDVPIYQNSINCMFKIMHFL